MIDSVLGSLGAHRTFAWEDVTLGVKAFLVLDDVTLGPGAGGIRTWQYASLEDAALDAARLARAMTIKCALAGLDAGGAKTVMLLGPNSDRRRAFEWLGEQVESLGGAYRTAGDLGTTTRDLEVMATKTRYVHTNETDLSRSVARGLAACMRACARLHGKTQLRGVTVSVQGAGAIGGAVARLLSQEGAAVYLSDLDRARAENLAAEIGATALDAKEALTAPVDIVAPCATGGVVDEDVARAISAWAVCGAANNILASSAAAEALRARSIAFVPDPIASAGAVVDGIGETVMGLADRTPLIDALGETAEAVLHEAVERRRTPTEVAVDRAWARIEAAGGQRRGV